MGAGRAGARRGWEIEFVLCGYKAWNPNTQRNEDVPEGHPDHPNFKRLM
ncbi:MAG TPA: hypothetical protein VHW70_14575 [Edaphobacter sp.]|jgi:hypothetical protein|nr:hypothetical protein [Edaphobacter sp.]